MWWGLLYLLPSVVLSQRLTMLSSDDLLGKLPPRDQGPFILTIQLPYKGTVIFDESPNDEFFMIANISGDPQGLINFSASRENPDRLKVLLADDTLRAAVAAAEHAELGLGGASEQLHTSNRPVLSHLSATDTEAMQFLRYYCWSALGFIGLSFLLAVGFACYFLRSKKHLFDNSLPADTDPVKRPLLLDTPMGSITAAMPYREQYLRQLHEMTDIASNNYLHYGVDASAAAADNNGYFAAQVAQDNCTPNGIHGNGGSSSCSSKRLLTCGGTEVHEDYVDDASSGDDDEFSKSLVKSQAQSRPPQPQGILKKAAMHVSTSLVQPSTTQLGCCAVNAREVGSCHTSGYSTIDSAAVRRHLQHQNSLGTAAGNDNFFNTAGAAGTLPPRHRHIAKDFVDDVAPLKIDLSNALEPMFLDLYQFGSSGGVGHSMLAGMAADGSGQGSDETSGIISDSDVSTLDRIPSSMSTSIVGGTALTLERFISLDSNDHRYVACSGESTLERRANRFHAQNIASAGMRSAHTTLTPVSGSPTSHIYSTSHPNPVASNSSGTLSSYSNASSQVTAISSEGYSESLLCNPSKFSGKPFVAPPPLVRNFSQSGSMERSIEDCLINTKRFDDVSAVARNEQHERVRSPTSPRSALKGSRGSNSTSINKQLRFTTLSMLTITCLLGLCRAISDTTRTSAPPVQVDLTVYLPRSYLRTTAAGETRLKRVEVFFNRSITSLDESSSLERNKVKGRSRFVSEKQRGGEAMDSEKLWIFDVENAARVESIALCRDQLGCPHACERSGSAGSVPHCVCSRGYQRGQSALSASSSSSNAIEMCADDDECLDGHPCPEGQRCVNVQGHYRCQCPPGSELRDGKCLDCGMPCGEGQFEWSSCSEKQVPRICRKCYNICPAGYFRSSKCSGKQHVACITCAPTCRSSEFETSPCLQDADVDRQCEDRSKLPGIRTPFHEQLVWEDLNRVAPVAPQVEISVNHANKSFTLDRGSGYKVHIEVLGELNLAPVMRPVDHSRANNNKQFVPNILNNTLRRFCPYPLALTFRLIAHSRENQQTAAVLSDSVAGYVPSLQPCETFKKFGQLNLDSSQGPVCAEPDVLTHLFGSSRENELRNHSSIFVNNVKNCAAMERHCFSCLNRCSGTSAAPRSDSTSDSASGSASNNINPDPNCQVSSHESDDGWSPKLAKCFNCCAKNQCANVCNLYYTPNCKPYRCMQGTLYQFSLVPQWHRVGQEIFHCHVELKPTRVYKLAYRLETPRSTAAVRDVFQLDIGPKDTRTIRAEREDQFGPLSVTYVNRISELPEVIGGDRDFQKAFRWDRSNALPLQDGGPVQDDSVEVWSHDPMSLSLDSWNRMSCKEAGGALKGLYRSNRGTPIVPLTDLTVDSSIGRYEYRVMHSSLAALLRLRIDPTSSMLEAQGFQSTSVRRNTLSADLFLQTNSVDNTRNWLVQVEGTVERMPGRFRIQLWDSVGESTPARLLYHYEVGVSQQKRFILQLPVPTVYALSSTQYNRTFQVRILDDSGRSDLLVRRLVGAEEFSKRQAFLVTTLPRPDLFTDTPASKVVRQIAATASKSTSNGNKINRSVEQQEALDAEESLAISDSAFYSLIGYCLFLLIMLFLGHLSAPTQTFRRNNALSSCHLMLFVAYVIIKAIYCCAVTLTALLIVLRAFASPPQDALVAIELFENNVAVTQKLHVARMDNHLRVEMARQQALVVGSRTQCNAKLDELWLNVEHIIDDLSQKSAAKRAKVQVSAAIAEHARFLLEQLRNDVATFRLRFEEYSTDAVMRMMTKMRDSTMHGLMNNDWLAAARAVYGMVVTQRANSQGAAERTPPRPFFDWLGIGQPHLGVPPQLKFTNSIPTPNISSFEVPPLSAASLRYTPFNSAQMPIPGTKNWKTVSSNAAAGEDKKQEADDEAKLRAAAAAGSASEAGEDIASRFNINWYHLLMAALVLDGLWMLHRLISTLDTVENILYGYPMYIDCTRAEKYMPVDGCVGGRSKESTQLKAQHPSLCKRLSTALKNTFVASMESDLVPRFVVSALLILTLYLVSSNLDSLVSADTLDGIGYYDNMLLPAKARYRLVNTQLATNAERLNQLELSFMERSADTRYQHYQTLIITWQRWIAAHEDTACVELLKYKRSLHDVPDHCLRRLPLPTLDQLGLTFGGCEFDKIIPKLYTSYDSEAAFSTLVRASLPLIAVWRRYCARLLFILFCFVAALVGWNALGGTAWFFLKRCQVLRQRRLYETDPDSCVNASSSTSAATCCYPPQREMTNDVQLHQQQQQQQQQPYFDNY